tara:strand:- start:268 stop:471 length:204 start_codon:yes stop_codon:yes gene_type:complete
MTNRTPYLESDYKGEFNLLLAEKELLLKVDKLARYKTSATALILGISPAAVCYKRKRHNIESSKYVL